MAGAVNRVDLVGLSGADFTNCYRTDDGGVAVTIRVSTTLRWESVGAFAEWVAVLDDLVWGLTV